MRPDCRLVKTWIWTLACASFLAVPTVRAQCKDAAIQLTQKRATFAAPEYSSQIQSARRAALEIIDHGLLGNSGSAINNKVARPPGASIAVAVDGKLVWAEGFGFADIEQCVPVVPKTKFRIGSTSKPLTAAGAALLSDQGRLDLDVPIRRYVPAFPDKGYPITTRQLLAHLGGIRDYTQAEVSKADRDPYRSVNESLKRFQDDPLAAPPGTRFIYATYGYVLASAVIEGASGQDFLSFMRDKVFLPLDMPDTVADEPSKIIHNRARWYNVLPDGTYRNSDYEDLSYKWAGGGFLSTAEDLARFGAALSKPGFLTQATLTKIFTSQKTVAGKETHYGLGWFIEEPDADDPQRRFEHTGGVGGSSSILVIYPDRGVVIAVVYNSNDFRNWPLLKIAAPFFADQK